MVAIQETLPVPFPSSPPAPQLRVLQPTPVRRPRAAHRERQDCSRCRHIHTCWSSSNDNHIILNLLVCRVQRDIERDRSMSLFLRMVHPKLLKVSQRLVEKLGSHGQASVGEILGELQSHIAEVLLTQYDVGDFGHPMHYLFDRKTGVVTNWAREYRRKHRQFYGTHMLYGDDTDTGEIEAQIGKLNRSATNGRVQSSPFNPAWPKQTKPTPHQQTIKNALTIVDDGMSLSLNEYRVMRFCLTHAREDGSRRIIGGLHRYLSDAMDTSRDIVSRHFQQAERRIIDAVGQTNLILKQRGVDVRSIPRYRKKRIRRVRGLTGSASRLTVQEIIDAMAFVEQNKGAALADIAWAWGVSPNTLCVFYRRFKDMSPDQIREELSDRLARDQQLRAKESG